MTAREENRLSQEHALRFILGGSATVIIKSTKTGYWHRYKVKRKKGTTDVWYVYSELLFDKIRESNSYLGFIRIYPENGKHYYSSKQAVFSEVTYKEGEKAIKAFHYTFDNLVAKKELPKELHIYHTGTCGVCNRPLKDEESVRLGIGPKCGGRT